MQILTVRQAHDLAGVYHSDSDLERDIKFEQFFRQHRYRVADTVTPEILAKCQQENLDFLITKD